MVKVQNIELNFSWNYFNNQKLEPIASTAPRVTFAEKIRFAEVNSFAVIALLCPIQAYPSPAYR